MNKFVERLNFSRQQYLLFFLVLIAAILIAVLGKSTIGFLIGMGLAVVALSFIDFRWLWYLSVMSMPFSMELSNLVGDSALTVPSDLIAFGFSFLILLKIPEYKEELKKIISHPISLMILAYLSWMFLASFFAEKPVFAFKFTYNTFWYLSTYFFWGTIFLRDREEFYFWLKLTLLPLLLVIVYTNIKHGIKGFSHQDSYYIMRPFYKEHTAYAASIAVYVPLYILMGIYGKFRRWEKNIYIITGFIVLIGVITSYTRGAWLGVMMAFVVFWALKLWGVTRVIIPFSLPIIIAGMVFFGADVFFSFSNTGNSTDKGLDKHIKSIVNLRTDESNKERINRWIAARAMLEERPLFGFGPGNYAMTYAPYQQFEFKTSISTNRGDGGTAHSEYFLAASEMGYIGLLIVILWYISCFYYGIKGVLYSQNYENRYLYMMALTGLTTFFVHSFFNNFMDQDKVAIPIFICMAFIVALDTFYDESQ